MSLCGSAMMQTLPPHLIVGYFIIFHCIAANCISNIWPPLIQVVNNCNLFDYFTILALMLPPKYCHPNTATHRLVL